VTMKSATETIASVQMLRVRSMSSPLSVLVCCD
jgi:hypothetical protein